jgi:hypothetical protein
MQAAPAGVGGCNNGARLITKQNRQAIGSHYGTDHAGLSGVSGISLRRLPGLYQPIKVKHRCAMHLRQPKGAGRQISGYAAAVFCDGGGIVANVIA